MTLVCMSINEFAGFVEMALVVTFQCLATGCKSLGRARFTTAQCTALCIMFRIVTFKYFLPQLTKAFPLRIPTLTCLLVSTEEARPDAN